MRSADVLDTGGAVGAAAMNGAAKDVVTLVNEIVELCKAGKV